MCLRRRSLRRRSPWRRSLWRRSLWSSLQEWRTLQEWSTLQETSLRRRIFQLQWKNPGGTNAPFFILAPPPRVYYISMEVTAPSAPTSAHLQSRYSYPPFLSRKTEWRPFPEKAPRYPCFRLTPTSHPISPGTRTTPSLPLSPTFASTVSIEMKEPSSERSSVSRKLRPLVGMRP